MSNKINTKCKNCRYCSPPSIIDETRSVSDSPFDSPILYLGAPKRKIVHRCKIGMNHTGIKSGVMLIDNNSDFRCSRFSRK